MLLAIFLHIGWGVAVLVNPAAARITGLHHLVLFFGPQWAALICLAAGLLALGGVSCRSQVCDWIFVGLIIPQQILLLTAFGSAFSAVYQGAFADGVPRPHAFILADQLPALLLLPVHTIEAALLVALKGRRRARWKATENY